MALRGPEDPTAEHQRRKWLSFGRRKTKQGNSQAVEEVSWDSHTAAAGWVVQRGIGWLKAQ